jgi:tetraacyldisaccharide 4'-kinase
LFAALLSPMARLYGRAAARAARHAAPQALPVPVVVVGNWVVGGAGKTPTVIALVQALAARGFVPGVVSRGYRSAADRGGRVVPVGPGSTAAEVGDEPLLIRRRTGAPVWVGADRPAAARALRAAHPEVGVIVADDGLMHHALPRAAEVWVFDERGIGNGHLLPAGPLRAPMPLVVPARARVLYTAGAASTPLPGALARRGIARAVPLAGWSRGDESAAVGLSHFAGRRVVAVAGIAAPQKFFAMLRAHGLSIDERPLPDHAALNGALPWPADAADVLVTEKDAVKLPSTPPGQARVWVVPLDFELPSSLVDDIAALLS